jgi:large subunit ribosomal protein L23
MNAPVKYTSERLMTVLLAPVVSEKGTFIADKYEQVIFRVMQNATKPEVKAAVELMFSVKVDSVQVVNETGKTRRTGKVQGRTQDIKKAYVRLASGQTIDYEAKLKA